MRATLAVIGLALAVAGSASAQDRLAGFESGAEGWACASWAEVTLDATGHPAPPWTGPGGVTEGVQSLHVPVRFTGQGYAQGYCGRAIDRSVVGAGSISADVTLGPGGPSGVAVKLVLFVGPGARWVEALAATPIVAGRATTVRLAFAGDTDAPLTADELAHVRGVGLKIEGRSVNWTGEVAVDAVRVDGAPPPLAADTGARPVGTFGGFQRGAGPDVPASNGFLTFDADGAVRAHALRWPKLGPNDGDFRLGEARFGGVPTGGARTRFVDWTTLEATAQTFGFGGSARIRAVLSRAFPAVRYETSGTSFTWATALDGRRAAARLLAPIDGRLLVYRLDQGGSIPLDHLSEPWVLVYAAGAGGWAFDAPVLLTFARRPRRGAGGSSGLDVSWPGAAGVVHVMPLYGLRRLGASETAAWERVLPSAVPALCRTFVPILCAFPVACDEQGTPSGDTVRVTDRYRHEVVHDDWGTTPRVVAPIPPVVYRASTCGYPVGFPAPPVETAVATFFGPFAFVDGPSATYTLPLPAGARRLPVALRVDGEPATGAVRQELLRVLRDQAPRAPATAFVDNNDRAACALAEAYPTLAAGSPERDLCQTVAPALVEYGYRQDSLQELTEPVTGQRYLNSAKVWCSSEPFDKEWYNGRQLAALALVSETFGLDLARAVWPKALGLYRYDRIFFDWATGSALSSVFGYTALADGMHFAWEGMLGTARLAHALGDDATWRDATYRAARQQTALFAAWHQAAWARDLDYAVGHLSHVKLPPNQVETRGAIDGYVEDTGCTTLEFRSLWQTTNFVFFDVAPQFSFYRDVGLTPRVRALVLDITPALHPSWADGNVMEPIDGKYYGTELTAAQLIARAALLHQDPGPLFQVYERTKGTAGDGQWYTMHRFGIAAPTLLAIERAHAPVVEVPTDVAVEAASWDASSGAVELSLRARRDVDSAVRTTAPGAAPVETALRLRAGEARVVRLATRPPGGAGIVGGLHTP